MKTYRGGFSYSKPLIERLMERLSITLRDATEKTDVVAVATAFAKCRNCSKSAECSILVSAPEITSPPSFCSNKDFFKRVQGEEI